MAIRNQAKPGKTNQWAYYKNNNFIEYIGNDKGLSVWKSKNPHLWQPVKYKKQRILPQLYIGEAEYLRLLEDNSIDIIITSPPYNLGQEKWPMGGGGRTARENGIGYSDIGDNMTEQEYQSWQIQCLKEFYRVAKSGASLFYNHKVRQRGGNIIHPMDWLRQSRWTIRQEIIWDRKSTHNHTPTLFWPRDERIYWLTKGRPILPDKSIGVPSVWIKFGPVPSGSIHPAPFTEKLPEMLINAIGKRGDIILDPFGGGMTTCEIAYKKGYASIGIDISEEYVKLAAEKFGVGYEWMMIKRT